jgi:hypothetical protein
MEASERMSVAAAVVGVVAGSRTEKPLELQRTIRIREGERNRCKEDGVIRKKKKFQEKKIVCRN